MKFLTDFFQQNEMFQRRVIKHLSRVTGSCVNNVASWKCFLKTKRPRSIFFFNFSLYDIAALKFAVNFRERNFFSLLFFTCYSGHKA